ncbi:MAG: hypothetical protein SNJ60_01535 [Pseudanabaenaceae cyanobacterium]
MTRLAHYGTGVPWPLSLTDLKNLLGCHRPLGKCRRYLAMHRDGRRFVAAKATAAPQPCVINDANFRVMALAKQSTRPLLLPIAVAGWAQSAAGRV